MPPKSHRTLGHPNLTNERRGARPQGEKIIMLSRFIGPSNSVTKHSSREIQIEDSDGFDVD